jgi:hypothetical protein
VKQLTKIQERQQQEESYTRQNDSKKTSKMIKLKQKEIFRNNKFVKLRCVCAKSGEKIRNTGEQHILK